MPTVAQSKARADLLLSSYLSMGSDRSLRRVREVAIAAGVRVALSTVTRYSSEHNWVAKAAEFDEKVAGGLVETALETAMTRDARQSRLGLAAQELAEKAMVKLGEAPETINASQAARLLAEGVKVERLAAGEATERIDHLVGLWESITDTVGPAYGRALEAALDAINVTDPALRQRAFDAASSIFVPEVDRSIETHFRSLGVGDVEVAP